MASMILAKAREFGADLVGLADVSVLKNGPSESLFPRMKDHSRDRFAERITTGLPHGAVFWEDGAQTAIVYAVAHPEEEPEMDWWCGGIDPPGNKKLAAVGKATAAALSRRALRADFVPAEQTTAALARLLLEELPEGGSVAIYRSDKGEKSFAEALSEKFSVRDIRAYTAAPGEYAASREELESADAFTFTSAAGARAALERCSPLPEGALLAALGNPTARALTGLDNRVAIAAEPSARSLAEAVADALSAEA